MQLKQEFLPFALPWIGEEEIEEVTACLKSGWLTTGPRTRQFEADFAAYVGSKYTVAVNSATAALHLALEAAGIQAGEEVLVPTMTFAATAEVVRYLGARPVLIDCHPATLNIDIQQIAHYLETQCTHDEQGAFNKQTKARVRAIIPVHYAGLPCDMPALLALAQTHNLVLIEDAAHALPARSAGTFVGTQSLAGAFSFYANKNITTGEGGMLTTDDEELANRVRMMSLHGISRDAWLRFTAQGSWYYEILEPGYKYNMTDIAAALGLVQLRRSDMLWKIRSDYARRYTEAFSRLPEIITPADAPPGDQHGWHLYILRIDPDRLKIDRAAFIEALKELGIGTSVHYIPLHQHPYYRATYGYCPTDMPVAKQAGERLITLPLYPRMTEGDVQRVIDAVTEIVGKYRR